MSAEFHDAHEREYTRRFDDVDIELPNIRVRGIGLMPELRVPEVDKGDGDAQRAVHHESESWFRVDGELVRLPTRYYDRSKLRAGDRIEGPGIINQYDTTTVLPPGFSAEIDRFGNIVMAVSAGATVGAAR